jgi:hypothetical protein
MASSWSSFLGVGSLLGADSTDVGGCSGRGISRRATFGCVTRRAATLGRAGSDTAVLRVGVVFGTGTVRVRLERDRALATRASCIRCEGIGADPYVVSTFVARGEPGTSIQAGGTEGGDVRRDGA